MDYTNCFQDVIRNYGFIDPVVEFIRHNENVTFKITDKGSGNTYLMRMHKPITTNMQGVQNRREAIQSELQFLLAWSSHSELPVQIPYPNMNGDLVTSVVIEGEEVHCSLLEWICGETMTKTDFTDEGTVRSLGERIAQLHRFSQSFQYGSSWIRPEYGLEWVNTMLSQLRAGEQVGIIAAKEFQTIEHAFALAADRIKGSSHTSGTWGFIHADIHNSNLIRTSRGISFIDFGLSGFGYYVTDVAMGALFTEKQLRDELLASYACAMSGTIDIEQAEDFMFLSICGYYAFLVSRQDKHDWIRERMPGLIERLCTPYVNGRRFFYDI